MSVIDAAISVSDILTVQLNSEIVENKEKGKHSETFREIIKSYEDKIRSTGRHGPKVHGDASRQI